MLYHYVVVRKDLPAGMVAAQCVHAAGESCKGVPVGTYAVVLAVENELELMHVAYQLSEAGIEHTLIREPDPPYNNSAMAIGLAPTFDRKEVKPVLGKLKLYG